MGAGEALSLVPVSQPGAWVSIRLHQPFVEYTYIFNSPSSRQKTKAQGAALLGQVH